MGGAAGAVQHGLVGQARCECVCFCCSCAHERCCRRSPAFGRMGQAHCACICFWCNFVRGRCCRCSPAFGRVGQAHHACVCLLQLCAGEGLQALSTIGARGTRSLCVRVLLQWCAWEALQAQPSIWARGTSSSSACNFAAALHAGGPAGMIKCGGQGRALGRSASALATIKARVPCETKGQRLEAAGQCGGVWGPCLSYRAEGCECQERKTVVERCPKPWIC